MSDAGPHRPTASAAGSEAYLAPAAALVGSARASDFASLTKPFLSGLVLATTGVGLLLAPGAADTSWRVVVATLLGTAAVIGAANALNCWWERDVDALMERTRDRPLPAGRMRPPQALAFAAVLTVGGIGLLLWQVNALAALLALIALVSYAFVYTPLKRLTAFSTLVGAIPGAIPPAIGWVAVSGHMDPGAWTLVAILFFWQPAHFLAIAWICREDYARAGMPMLPVLYPAGHFVGRQIVLYSLALLPVSLALIPLSRAGELSLIGSLVLGVGLVAVALPGAFREPTYKAARRTFLASIGYMFLLLILLSADCLLIGGRGM